MYIAKISALPDQLHRAKLIALTEREENCFEQRYKHFAPISAEEYVLDFENNRIEVRAYKYDGLLHRTWDAELLRQKGSLVVLDAKFSEEIIHDMLGTIASGTHSLEYYWLDRWYNIFRFAQPDGELRNYYCNVNVPATFEGEVLSYVDLDVDILVQPDFSYQILDLDEFEKNSALYDYSLDVRQNAQLAVSELITMIETRAFPFGQ